jgi:hypothetical protein
MNVEKQKTETCLICTKLPRSRGLCSVHYKRYGDKLRSFETEAEKSAFEEECISAGWLLPASAGGRPKLDEDPFGSIADKIRAANDRKAVQNAIKKPSPKRKKSG